ncbi:hypothetical protein Glove_83g78 [Diversispora epigaea]|uniref:Uncharacterized protein n=1 Tax=Diversispora epigaea TaxID=1348612 RepID=A0A397JEE6_9GLOM|nr:hypothetical protein Glove_83g78 [Diversispora epigaea]
MGFEVVIDGLYKTLVFLGENPVIDIQFFYLSNILKKAYNNSNPLIGASNSNTETSTANRKNDESMEMETQVVKDLENIKESSNGKSKYQLYILSILIFRRS